MRSTRTVGKVLLLLMMLFVAGCGGNEPYRETFDEPGSWRTESGGEVEGQVRNGVYDFIVRADELTSWTTAGEQFSDGIYQVEAMQVEGPDNNGYGMLFRVDDEQDDFYVFQISGDGFVWIGRYRNAGEAEAEPLVGEWWFESPAVNQGANVTNTLRVHAEGQNMIFYVNDQEAGRVTDDAFRNGDIGLMVRSLGESGVHVQFDNFTVTPIDN